MKIDEARAEAILKVKVLHAAMSKLISGLLVDSRERSLALTNLEQAEMWACRSIEDHGIEENLKESAEQMLAEIESGVIMDGIVDEPVSPPRNYEYMLEDVSVILSNLMRTVSIEYHEKAGE